MKSKKYKLQTKLKRQKKKLKITHWFLPPCIPSSQKRGKQKKKTSTWKTSCCSFDPQLESPKTSNPVALKNGTHSYVFQARTENNWQRCLLTSPLLSRSKTRFRVKKCSWRNDIFVDLKPINQLTLPQNKGSE